MDSRKFGIKTSLCKLSHFLTTLYQIGSVFPQKSCPKCWMQNSRAQEIYLVPRFGLLEVGSLQGNPSLHLQSPSCRPLFSWTKFLFLGLPLSWDQNYPLRSYWDLLCLHTQPLELCFPPCLLRDLQLLSSPRRCIPAWYALWFQMCKNEWLSVFARLA